MSSRRNHHDRNGYRERGGADEIKTSMTKVHLTIRLGWLLSGLFLAHCTAPNIGWIAADYQRLTYRNFRDDARFQAPLDFDALDYPRLHAAIFYTTNVARVRHNRPVLRYHAFLEQAAQSYAQRMVRRDFFAHEDPYAADRRTVAHRVRAVGVANPRPSENLAIYFGIRYRPREPVYALRDGNGQFSRQPNGPPILNHSYLSFAEAVVDFWSHSPKHRDNMLAKEAVQLGCGAAFFWDVQGFPKFKVVQVLQWFEPVEQ